MKTPLAKPDIEKLRSLGKEVESALATLTDCRAKAQELEDQTDRIPSELKRLELDFTEGDNAALQRITTLRELLRMQPARFDHAEKRAEEAKHSLDRCSNAVAVAVASMLRPWLAELEEEIHQALLPFFFAGRAAVQTKQTDLFASALNFVTTPWNHPLNNSVSRAKAALAAIEQVITGNLPSIRPAQ